MAIDLGSLMEKSLAIYTSDHKSVVSMNLFVALLCACIVIGHLLEENRWMNESITALAIVSFYIFYNKIFLRRLKWWNWTWLWWTHGRVWVPVLSFCWQLKERVRISWCLVKICSSFIFFHLLYLMQGELANT